MSEVRPTPSLAEIIEAVKQAGSGQDDFFGYPVREDGLYLQQDPEEYGAFVHFVASQVPAAELSLEIGIASGGQTKFLRDYWQSKKTLIVDIGLHELFPHWARIKQQVKTDICLEIIDDSHAPHVREKLLPYAGKVDFAFVDGDHSYRGLKQDIFLTKELLRPGGLMVLHDTAAVGDCKKVFDELLFSKDFTLVRNFQNRFGISVWKMVRVKRMPNAFNRATGWGRI
jgi:Methyltransferase domain